MLFLVSEQQMIERELASPWVKEWSFSGELKPLTLIVKILMRLLIWGVIGLRVCVVWEEFEEGYIIGLILEVWVLNE